jgi:hypothetical protein
VSGLSSSRAALGTLVFVVAAFARLILGRQQKESRTRPSRVTLGLIAGLSVGGVVLIALSIGTPAIRCLFGA